MRRKARFPIRFIAKPALLGLVSMGVALSAAGDAQAVAAGAEIVLLIGKGETRASPTVDWSPAAVKQQVQGGALIRTLANSQLALLMADRTQIRLNQNSQLQIKSQVESSQWTENTVRLNSGRAWSQARPQTAQRNAADLPKLTMETPSATMSIRGTDWEVEVFPDGRTQLVVLSGQVAFGNELGSIEIGDGEAAIAETGKAPVKLILLNPASRVQWVSSWKPQARRWIGQTNKPYSSAIQHIDAGNYSAALNELKPAAEKDAVAAMMAADLLIFQGEHETAVKLLRPYVSSPPNPLAVALLARAWARTDNFQPAIDLLDTTIAVAPTNVELQLARGELSILQGDAKQARQAYRAALDLAPENAEAWYGLGLIEAERENVRAARTWLQGALSRNSGLSKASAELAAVETFAGQTTAAEKLLDDLLTREPENYIALTARGINRLKEKRTREALDDFLRVGLIEPRYARAWLYSGVAFYQLGETPRALQAFKRAAALDERNPVPYLLQSVVHADSLDYGASIDAASEAQVRMPYLKSLNQVANNQKGNANLGSALANFGLNEWATFYADEAYSPYWAGSHLFRADRYTGKFNKNSELFQGFLTDPTVFGASNRNASLINTPGHYGRIDTLLESTDWRQAALIGTVNGLTVDVVPLAYFLSGDLSGAEARKDESSAHGKSLTLGLGAKPRHDLGLFGFAVDARITSQLRSPALPDAALKQEEKRGDFGLNFKWTSDNQFWLKTGDGNQQNSVTGPYVSPSTAESLNKALSTTIFTPRGYLDTFKSKIDQDDTQFRHAFTLGPILWTWGVEKSHQTKTGQLVTTFSPARLSIDERFSVDTTDAYVSGRYQNTNIAAQLDFFSQRVEVKRSDVQSLDLLLAPPEHFSLQNETQERKTSEINPRLGIKWSLGKMENLRLVGQKWRRSGAAATLSAVDTLGIQVNDALPTAGGLYERARLQYDRQAGQKLFFQTFVDHERIDNGLGGKRTAITGFELTQLESLRSRPEIYSPTQELEQTPVFDQGWVNTLGVGTNIRLSERHTLTGNYRFRDSRQTGDFAERAIPYLPKHYLQLGSHWSLPGRWQLGAQAIYRNKRFRDDANLDPIDAGWSFGLTSYWETADKQSSVQAILDNLLSDEKSADTQSDPHLVIRYTYRF